MSAVQMGYVPGAVRFAYPARERRTPTYRTWNSRMGDGLGWCAECLLCGDWRSGFRTRERATHWSTTTHRAYCHVTNGCHCYWPHLTAAMGARLGLAGGRYPRHLAGVLFRMAGGRRKPCPPVRDLNGTLHGRWEG